MADRCHSARWIASILACWLASTAAASEWVPIALPGDPAPGLEGAFDLVTHPVVFENGEIGFQAFADDDGGVFRWSPSQGISLRVSQQQLRDLFAPGSPTFFLDEMLWNDTEDGLVRTWWSTTGGPGCVDLPLAIHLPRHGDPRRVASIGQAVGDGTYLRRTNALLHSNAGEVAGSVWVVDTPCVPDELSGWTEEGIVGPDGAGGLDLVALLGSPLDADEDGRVVSWAGNLSLDDSGAIVFEADLAPPGGPPDRFVLYRRVPGGAPVPLAVVGEPVPGLAPTALLESFWQPAGNAAGSMVVRATVGEDLLRADLLIFSSAGGPFEPWVRTGDPAPVDVPGATLELGDAFPSDLRLSDGGVLAFTAQVVAGGDSREALFVRDIGGALTARALGGAPPPGLGFDDWMWFAIEHVDDDGSLLFQARLLPDLSDAIGPPIQRRGLFLSRPDEAPQLLVASGESFELAPGQPEALDSILVAQHQTLDTIAAIFTGQSTPNRSALYALAVPEPCASLAGAGAFAALGLLASRQRAGRPIGMGCRTRASRAC
jgi:hypothetical protein